MVDVPAFAPTLPLQRRPHLLCYHARLPEKMMPSNTKPVLIPLRGKKLVHSLFVLAVVACLTQIALGASFTSVFFCLLCAAGGLLVFTSLGPYNVASWFALVFVLGNSLVALYAKTLLGQALDSYLLDADTSFFVLAVTSWSLLAAILLVRSLKVGAPVLCEMRDPRRLMYFSWGCFLVGLTAVIVNRLLNDVDDEAAAIGAVAMFRDVILMAVIARTAMVLETSGNEKSVDFGVLFFVSVGIFCGLVDNQKTGAALPVIAYFATVMFYRRGIPGRVILAVAAGATVFTVLVAPAVHALRVLGQQQMSIGERAEFVIDTASTLISQPGRLDEIKELSMLHFLNGYYNYFGDEGGSQMLLGRYASVQQIDPIVALAQEKGFQGGDALWPALPRLMPRFLIGEKDPYIPEYYTVLHYGLIDPEGGKYPTLPIAGQSFAAYGIWGVLTVPFAVFLLLFTVLKKLAWNMDRNIYGIFFACQFVVAFASQGSFGQYVGAATRGFPLLAVVFLLLTALTRIKVRASERLVRRELRT